MPDLTTPHESQAIPNLLYPALGNYALILASAVSTAGPDDTTGEDVATVLSRKLEAAGVIVSGTGAPVFANETAIFYLDTETDRFYVREASAYTPLAVGATETEIIGHDTVEPTSSPTAASPWIYIRTDRNQIWLKERLGSAGSYTYSWAGPIFEGQHRTEIVYNTADDPGNLSISWDWETDTFSPSGGGWTGNSTNAKWAIIVSLPRNANNAVASPPFRVGEPGPVDITFDAKDGQGNLPASVTNLQEVIDWLNTTNLGSSTPAQTPTASPDNYYLGEWSPSGALQNVGSQVSQQWTLPTALANFASRYQETLFAEGFVAVDLERGAVTGALSVEFAILDTSGNALTTPIRAPLVVNKPNDDRRYSGQARIAGALPAGRTAGQLRVTVTANTGTPASLAASIPYYRLEVRPEVTADEIVVDDEDLGNNLPNDGTIKTNADVISAVDELPIQPADYEDVSWPGEDGDADGVDANGDGVEVKRRITLHRNIQYVNDRPGHAFTGRITYTAAYIAGSGAGGETSVAFNHKIYLNDSPTAVVTQTFSGANEQDATATTRVVEFTIPANTTHIDVGIQTPDASSNDARLRITNYRLDYDEGIDASGFTDNERILNLATLSLQTLAKQLYDARLQVPVDASAFTEQNRLLYRNTSTLQEIANALYAATAAKIPVTTTGFSDPGNFAGGLRQVTGVAGIPDAPSNAQEAFVKTDYLLQQVFNPFEDTQLLDRSTAGGVVSTFSVVNATPIYSNPVDIPAELRDLGTDIAVRIRVEIPTLDAAFRGDLRLVDPDNRTTVFFGAPEVVSGALQSSGGFVTFSRTIAAASVPDTFEVRFRRTDGGTGATNFSNGYANVVDATGRSPSGVGGQVSGYNSAIIWRAGELLTERRTTVSEVDNLELMAGHRFSDYNQLVFVFDGGAGATQPLLGCWVDANLFQAFGANGTLWIAGNYWLMVSRQDPRHFRWRWRANVNGLRRVMGIRTN